MANESRVVIHGSMLQKLNQRVGLLLIAQLHSYIKRCLHGCVGKERNDNQVLLHYLADIIDAFKAQSGINRQEM